MTDGHMEHLVQFYENRFPAAATARFLGTGFAGGDAVVVIATPTHREQLEQEFHACHLRVAGPHYVALDAADTLAQFMVDGSPDEARFHEVVGEALRAASASGALRVRAFGEMVALLAGEQSWEAVVRLERLWNDLLRQRKAALLCTYPLSAFGVGECRMDGICALHTQVVPGPGGIHRESQGIG
jgi:hypothetical protein